MELRFGPRENTLRRWDHVTQEAFPFQGLFLKHLVLIGSFGNAFSVTWHSSGLEHRHSGCPIPDGQELKSEIQKDGSKTLYHVNLGTGIRVNSVEDMFCYKNSKSRENNPKQNYVNLGTGIRVNSVEDMFRYKDRESGKILPSRLEAAQSRPSILQSVQGSWPQYLPLPLAQQAAIVKPTAAGQLAILHAV
ncbi:hypothetical protein Prudu_006653 [Prunus dulcis]|uniref:Uncharacterized protein n=1 Tax=Prunus dulcis TaxID=3755 RepID=A0A4Y1R092_PRUDU|nr:hypothetical protein Prudu_006653 [Prunus dulcis]